MKAKKHLGQHFLTSKAALRDMIKAAQVEAGDTILEIGPGKGVLTAALLETGARVVAVETDADMIEILEKVFTKEIEKRQLQLVHGDVLQSAPELLLKLDVKKATNAKNNKAMHQEFLDYKLVANIPYYITGEILRKFLTTDYQPESITVLIQKEVAERIARSTKETILSLSVKAYGAPRYVATIPARYFSPAPKVDSAILHIAKLHKNNFIDVSEDRFFKVVKAGFASKRKQLVNNLAQFGAKEDLVRVLAGLGLSERARAEDVTLTDWLALARTLT